MQEARINHTKNTTLVLYNNHEFQFKSERPRMKSYYFMFAVA